MATRSGDTPPGDTGLLGDAGESPRTTAITGGAPSMDRLALDEEANASIANSEAWEHTGSSGGRGVWGVGSGRRVCVCVGRGGAWAGAGGGGEEGAALNRPSRHGAVLRASAAARPPHTHRHAFGQRSVGACFSTAGHAANAGSQKLQSAAHAAHGERGSHGRARHAVGRQVQADQVSGHLQGNRGSRGGGEVRGRSRQGYFVTLGRRPPPSPPFDTTDEGARGV
jgi:hypothetical protein